VRVKAESLRATTTPQLLCGAEVSGTAGEAGEVVSDGGDQITEQFVKLFCGLVGAMNRRELLQLLGWVVTAVSASPVVSDLDAEEQERLARAIVSPSRVDEKVIDHLDAILQYCKRQNDTWGPRAVLDTVLAQRNLARDLTAGCPAALRPRLLSLYSNMSGSV
jgi:hypothetical protein